MLVRSAIADPAWRALAIESATSQLSVAACRDGQVLCRAAEASGEQSRSVYNVIHEVLDAQALSLDGLDCIAFGRGPGGFTGLRVGASVTQALAFGAGLPVVPVSSLAALAHAALRDGDAQYALCCLDARMGEVYFAVYRRHADGVVVPVVAEQLADPEGISVPASIVGTPAGTGWSAYPALSDRLAAHCAGPCTVAQPSAVEVLDLARLEFRAGRTVAAADAIPNYIRNKVADKSRGRAN